MKRFFRAVIAVFTGLIVFVIVQKTVALASIILGAIIFGDGTEIAKDIRDLGAIAGYIAGVGAGYWIGKKITSRRAAQP